VKSSAEFTKEARKRAEPRSVSIDGINANYWFYPATMGDAAKAKNLVLVHGYRGDHHGLEAFAGGLTDFNVYSPDLPGFGTSAALNVEHSLNSYADWFKTFLQEIKLEKPLVVGHSFGTLVVSATEAKLGLFEKIVLVNPVAGGRIVGVSKLLMEFVKFYYWVAHIVPEVIGNRMTKTYLLVDSMSAYTTKSKDKTLRKWVKEQHRTHFNSFANSQVVWEAYVASTENVVTPYVKEIHKPVLLIAAELDEITPVSAVYEFARTMDHAEVYEIKGCGHLVHYEAADEAADAIRRFLDLPGTSA
jgi:pimeloyl-ACP methyl ester carboxylesterase